jgi:pyruvate-formate lyase-activating enzyme
VKKRKIPQITLAKHPDQGRKCWVALSGCNFDCKACISAAKEGIGRALSVEELIDLIVKSCNIIYEGEMINRMCLTGGEPTLDIDYLLLLIDGLKRISIKKFELSTNGYFFSEDLLEKFCSLDIDLLIKLDLKAYNEEIHKQYTGKSNVNVLKTAELLSRYAPKLHKYGPSFVVRTVYMPDIFELVEIEEIARYLSKVDKNICYRIQQFSPVHGKNISRRPTFEEMLIAYNVARRYLSNVIVSTYLPTRPEYNYVEIRADELLETFNEIDRKSKIVIESWNVKYFSMNQVLNSKGAKLKWEYTT